MTGSIKVGDRVTHYQYGRGVVERLLSEGLAEVHFENNSQYVEQRNLQSLDGLEREAQEKKERKRQEAEQQRNAKREAKTCALKDRVLSFLEDFDYEAAHSLYQGSCMEWWPRNEYDTQVSRAKKEQARKSAEEEYRKVAAAREKLRGQVRNLLDAANYGEADRLYHARCADWWGNSDYKAAKFLAQFMHRFVETYRSGSLAELDAVYQDRPTLADLSIDDFVTLKLPKVRGYLTAIRMQLDEEQEQANARPESRILIKARAGSGKTRTLCARAALAILDEKLDPNQVMILAFNKDAATEVRRRIQKMAGIPDYENARTFHSLAYQLVKPRKKLLFDAGGQPSQREQSRFVQCMMRRIMNPVFKEAMVEFFRKELEQIEDIGRDLSPDEYSAFRRALEQVTLGAERVKSNGEKFIADFLFEHDIEYRYERPWVWRAEFLDGAIYKPDFSIVANGKDFILEHWAIDPRDTAATLPEHWGISAEIYRQQILDKQVFWRSKGVPLLETHTGQMRQGRKAFENQLKIELERSGIQCKRLSEGEIARRVFKNDFTISSMAKLFLQFIQRSKKRGWSPDEVARRIADEPDRGPRAKLFHQLALRAYSEYEAMLEEEHAMDFDDLLRQAAEEVKIRGACASIHLGRGNMLWLGDLKWILMDEYQDFSELYFRMLEEILKANPNVRLVAVGDNWQAINAFAGAEIRFFDRFSECFSGAESVGVTTNYRSDRAVVAAGNRLMMGYGSPGKVSRAATGRIDLKYLDDVWIEFRQVDRFRSERKSDALYLPPRSDGRNPSESDLRQAKALKQCVQIVFEAPGQQTMLLSRTGKAYGLELKNFRRRLIEILSVLQHVEPETLEKFITIMTAHGSKGKEAGRVIILDATERQFPKVHPDNLLFEPFGVTPRVVLDEERRLFYVAITRAEHSLYVLTEKGKESPYLALISEGSMATENEKGIYRTKPAPLGKLAEKIKARVNAIEGVCTAPLGRSAFRKG